LGAELALPGVAAVVADFAGAVLFVVAGGVACFVGAGFTVWADAARERDKPPVSSPLQRKKVTQLIIQEAIETQ
jgi:arginine exporter protein ArgO